jgi:hypothetical protein
LLGALQSVQRQASGLSDVDLRTPGLDARRSDGSGER